MGSLWEWGGGSWGIPKRCGLLKDETTLGSTLLDQVKLAHAFFVQMT